jgi:hypothetical protein
MPNFYIKKLIVSGNGNEPSVLEFDEGLNIICGPSNTGKSYILECIDYLFGSDNIRFDRKTGYNNIKIIVDTDNGSITFDREIDSNKIKVHSNDHRIESGDYRTSGKKNISDVWLRLIGIDEEHFIIKNSRYDKQRLTWRTFSHMFLIKESVVFQEPSILLPKQNTAHTAALSALFFLITGQDFADSDPKEEKKIKEARKKAVVDYINKRLSDFAERKNELNKLPVGDEEYLQEKVENVLAEIAETESKITDFVNRSKQLLKEIYVVSEQLAECNTLYNRYQALKSQYASDIKRLTFIVEGELHKRNMHPNSKCPFCDSSIPSLQKEATYAEASHAELHRIQLQLDDLVEAEQDLIKERSVLESKLATLNSEKSDVELLIKDELKPKIAALKATLYDYRRAIEIRNESVVISKYETTMKSELFEAMIEEESEVEFKIKNYFSHDIIATLDSYLNRVLESCKFDAYSSAYLDPSSFDIIINGTPKNTYGKGYRAFLNTVLAISLMEYLSDKGKYAPELLIIDSPILSLKEKGDGVASDTMKAALFQYLLDNQAHGQVIIVENDIPDLDYSNANVIQFTKDESYGRYGFLNGVRQ